MRVRSNVGTVLQVTVTHSLSDATEVEDAPSHAPSHAPIAVVPSRVTMQPPHATPNPPNPTDPPTQGAPHGTTASPPSGTAAGATLSHALAWGRAHPRPPSSPTRSRNAAVTVDRGQMDPNDSPTMRGNTPLHRMDGAHTVTPWSTTSAQLGLSKLFVGSKWDHERAAPPDRRQKGRGEGGGTDSAFEVAGMSMHA